MTDQEAADKAEIERLRGVLHRIATDRSAYLDEDIFVRFARLRQTAREALA